MALCAAAIVAVSCNKKSALPSPETPAPPMQPFGPPPTEEEAKQFAQKLEEAVRAHDVSTVEQLLRTRDLVQRSVSDLGLSEQELRDVMRGADIGIKESSLGERIVRQVSAGGSFKLLRVHVVDGRPRALFRLILSTKAVNYHDFVVARYADGAIAMEDVYVFTGGEMLSQAMRRIMIPFVAEMRGGKGLNDADADYIKHLSTFIALADAAQHGQLGEASRLMHQLPQKLQDNKTIMLVYLSALARQADNQEAEYVRLMERFRELYPNDACVDFISIDYFTLKKDYDAVLKAVERVNENVGGDPHLLALKAIALIEAKRYDEALKKVEAALKEEPDLETAHWARITLSLREKKHAETLAGLKKFVEVCDAKVNISSIQYDDFRKSPQYREWEKWYAEFKKK
jgi:tetratricopeptide (TPR) repeat protein